MFWGIRARQSLCQFNRDGGKFLQLFLNSQKNLLREFYQGLAAAGFSGCPKQFKPSARIWPRRHGQPSLFFRAEAAKLPAFKETMKLFFTASQARPAVLSSAPIEIPTVAAAGLTA